MDLRRLCLVAGLALGACQIRAAATIELYSAEPFMEYLPPNAETAGLRPLTALRGFATPGETEPLTCAIRSPGGVDHLSVSVSALSDGRHEIPASAVDLGILKYWYQRGLGWRGRQLIPEVIWRDDGLVTVDLAKKTNQLNFEGLPVDATALRPFSIPANTLKQLWLTLRIPRDAVAGVYRGKLTLKTGETEVGAVPVEFEVLPFRLDEPKKQYGIYWPTMMGTPGDDAPRKNDPWRFVSEEVFRAQCEDLRSHGVTHPQFTMPLKVRADGTIDFTDTEKMIRIRNEYGLMKPPYFVSGIRGLMEAASSEAGMERYIGEVKQVLAYFKMRGFEPPHIYGVDEAYGERLEKAVTVYRRIREAGGKIAVAAHTNNQTTVTRNVPGWYEIAGPDIDLPIIAQNLLIVPDAELRKVHAHGHRAWLYAMPQIHWDEYSPYMYRNNYGFWLFASRADGAAPWGYQYFVGNPYDEFDAVAEGTLTDCFAAYPTRNGVIPTVGWEAFREGVDDCRYASTLENLIIKTRSALGDAAVHDAEKWMKEKSVPFVHVVNDLYDRKKERFRPMLVYDPKLKEQLAARPNLQQVRRGYVDQILELRRALPPEAN